MISPASGATPSVRTRLRGSQRPTFESFGRIGCVSPVRDRPRPRGTRKLADGSCYANAYRRATERGWRYVEGVAAAFEGVVVPHAWCADDGGFVVETTWKAAGCAYFGVEVPLDAVAGVLLETGRHAAVLPLLAGRV